MAGELDIFRSNWKEDVQGSEKWKEWMEAFAQEINRG